MSVVDTIVLAYSTAASDQNCARRLGRISVRVSIAGIVVIVILGIILYLVLVVYASSIASSEIPLPCTYKFSDTCYRYRTYVGTGGTCSGYRYNNYCYYTSCNYSLFSECYSSRIYVGPHESCSGYRYSSYCYYT